VTFPLKAWIDDHASVPHHLSHSGMGGMLRSYDAAIARPEASDEVALRKEIAAMIGVPPSRLFLTHGATEANALTLSFLAESARRAGTPRPRCAFQPPEYPPLTDAAQWLGLEPVAATSPHEMAITSSPVNPTGLRRSPEEVLALGAEGCPLVVDETFRQFTERPSLAPGADRRTWVLGSFTKVFGGDDLRIGYVIAPEVEVEAFGRFYSVVLDDIPDASVQLGRALLRDRDQILTEVRDLFGANLRTLQSLVPGVPRLEAPVFFDRGRAGLDGDGLARAALEEGILVCPGSLFDDPTGVRLCLTQRSFDDDLAAYLSVRERFMDAATA
jgi:histidinol-phosphate/aromatic aminotransferase/cobyric acid decarboxylase-like protein